MDFERFERGYLLPKGCKDLVDAIGLQPKPQTEIFLKLPFIGPKPKPQTPGNIFLKKPSSPPPVQAPAMQDDLLVSNHITVKELAALLGQKPFKIIADAMELGVFPNVNQSLDFQTISCIASKYGYTAKKKTA